MIRPRLANLIFLCLIIAAPAIGAEITYVSDTTHITPHSGEGTGFKNTRMLTAGERLEVLATNTTSDYSQARTKAGDEDRVLTQYQQNQPIAADRLEKIKVSAQLGHDNQTKDQLLEENSRLQQNLEQLSTELADIRESAARLQETEQHRDQLKSRLATVNQENDRLKLENERLMKDQSRYWFLVGGGVLLGGMLLGLIIPKIRWRQRQDQWRYGR